MKKSKLYKNIPIQFRKYFDDFNGNLFPTTANDGKYEDEEFVKIFGNSPEEIENNLEKII